MSFFSVQSSHLPWRANRPSRRAWSSGGSSVLRLSPVRIFCRTCRNICETCGVTWILDPEILVGFFWSLTLLFLVVNSSHPYPDLLACTESFPDATSHLYSQALDILACPIFSGFGRTIWLGILAQNTFMVWNSWVQCSYNPYIGLDSC